MTTDLANNSVVDQAFRIMEVTPPANFEDGSPMAAAAKNQFAAARDIALESYDWSFARKVALLPPVADEDLQAADPDLPYVFALPGDCLALRHVYTGGTAYPWRRDGMHLRTAAQGNLRIRYTRRVERQADMPRTFQLVMSYQLAMLLAPKFVTTRAKRIDIQSELSQALDAARRVDAHTASQHRLTPRIGGAAGGNWVDEALQ